MLGLHLMTRRVKGFVGNAGDGGIGWIYLGAHFVPQPTLFPIACTLMWCLVQRHLRSFTNPSAMGVVGAAAGCQQESRVAHTM